MQVKLRKIAKLTLSILLLFIALLISFLSGVGWQFFRGTEPAYTMSWASTIRANVYTIALLKAGDTQAAVRELERPLDASVRQLAGGHKPFDIKEFKEDIVNYDPHLLEAFQLARVYHFAYDSWEPQDEVVAVLDAVPSPRGYCAPWLQDLVDRARAREEDGS